MIKRNPRGRLKNKPSVKSKKTTDTGRVTFKSKLESYCNRALKEAGLNFTYEGESFVVLNSFMFKGGYYKSTKGNDMMLNKTGIKQQQISYTPDFVSHEHKFIIETKGFIPSNHSFPIRMKLFLAFLNNNGMGDYSVFIPKSQKQVDQAVKIITQNIAHG